MTSGVKWKPYTNKKLSAVPHSPFGDFPKDYMPKKLNFGVSGTPAILSGKAMDLAEVSIAARGTPMLKKG